MSAPGRIVKKGEFLFKEGDKIANIHVIQTGALTVCLNRPKKNIDLMALGPAQILGEQALSGSGQYPFSAVATTETKVLEISVDILKQSVESSPQMLKVLIKSLLDRLKFAINEIKSNKMERDSVPCPEDQVAKVFGSLFHTANHKGTKETKKPNAPGNIPSSSVNIEWDLFRHYAQRVFGESPKRLEQALCILVKLKLARFEMGRPPEDPEGPEMIMKVELFDLAAVEAFVEFYQYYYFKGGARGDILKVDDSCANFLNQFLVLSEGLTPDRLGIVTVEYPLILASFKKDLAINLSPDHFTRLEQKGVFSKRLVRQDGTVALQFDLKEFKMTQKVWRILREIDKWNEKGFVDMNEEPIKLKAKTDGPACPQCSAAILAQSKFCSECGFKIAA